MQVKTSLKSQNIKTLLKNQNSERKTRKTRIVTPNLNKSSNSINRAGKVLQLSKVRRTQT